VIARYAALALAVLLAGCGGAATSNGQHGTSPSTLAPSTTSAPAGATSPCGVSATATGADHVLWIWMENHTSSDVFGSGNAPYTAKLARSCGRSSHYSDVGSPSLPNYVGATSGGTQGIADDNPPASHPLTVDNLFRQVRATGRSALSYEESMTRNCQLDTSGEYAVKHNPAPYYVGADDRAACQRDDVPLGDLASGALARALDGDTLPAFSLVTPNLCDDTHDCPVATGDAFLARWMPRILSSTAYQRGRTVVFIVWDEPTPMPFVVVAPTTVPGTVSAVPADHFALLRTTEELLGLPLLGHAATASSLRAAFNL
jgi:Phosphoesterase family